jgi:hypothetical protein
MKKILTILFILLLSSICFAGRVQQAHKAVIAAKNGATPPSQSFTLEGGAASAGYADSPQTVQLTNVASGELVVVTAGWYNQSGTPTVSDGTSSFTAADQNVYGSYYSQIFYLTSSVSTGTVTYTFTLSGATFVCLTAHRISYDAAISLDDQSYSSGVSTSPTTGDITTTANVTVSIASEYSLGGGAMSSFVINGQAASGGQSVGNFLQSGVYISSSTFTGSGDGAFADAQPWNFNIISFK